MYDYPGVPSVTIAYFDTNDFYFSGHVGSCMIYTCELMALGHPKLSLIGLIILINQWIYLTFTRSHFVIDMMTGVAVGITAHRGGEFVSYLADVLIFRFRKERRQPYWYKPCGRCGWNVANASLLVNKAEEEYQKQIYCMNQTRKSVDLMSTPDQVLKLEDDEQTFEKVKDVEETA